MSNRNVAAWKKEKAAIECFNCGYKWRTASKLGFVSCPNCGKKVVNPSAQLWKKNEKEEETT